MSDSGDWILKIISGPHQGAEVPLRSGRITVGAHADCDLVLHDVLVAPQHLALSLDAKGVVTVEPLEGRVYNNGKRLLAPALVAAFGFITVGTTHFVLGPSAARWPLLSPADVPELEKDAPAPATAPLEPAVSSDVSVSDDDKNSSGKKNPKPPTPAQRRRALWMAGFGGVLLLVWIGLWLMWAPRSKIPPQLTLRERAEKILQAFPDARTLSLDEQADGLAVTGYLDSDSLHREIANAFREEAPELTIRLWSNPRMLETARAFLAQRNLPQLTVSPGEKGELKISGSAHSAAEWARTRQMLLSEVPGLVRLHEDVIFNAVAVTPAAPSTPLFAPIVTPPSSAASAPLTVVALQPLADGQGWLRLSDGTVHFRGARLPDGARLAAIREDQAFIEKDGLTFALTLGTDLAHPLPALSVTSSSPPVTETKPVSSP